LCSTEYITEEPSYFSVGLTTEITKIIVGICWIWHTFYRICTGFHFCFILQGLLPNPKQTPFILSFFIAQVVTTFSGMLSDPFDTVMRRMMMQVGSSLQTFSKNYLLDF